MENNRPVPEALTQLEIDEMIGQITDIPYDVAGRHYLPIDVRNIPSLDDVLVEPII
jgi:hypothetical protein